MESGEALDHQVIAERAEELRSWLGGLGLTGRTYGALERELSGIIANDPGGYINGQRPLAGMTVDEFIVALHSRNGGAVGQVKSVGDAALRELRETIEPIVPLAPPQAAPAALEAAPPELETPDLEAVAPEAETPAEAPAEAPAAPRRRGRPKGSKAAARNGAAPHAPMPVPAAAEAAPRRRGRPRKDAAQAPAPGPTAQPRPRPVAQALAPQPAQSQLARPPAPRAPGDPALDQLVQLWPELHPHARRAVVLYASALLAEAGAEG